MPAAAGAFVIERLADRRCRATCPLFPDCEAIAPTEEEARQALEEAIERILAERDATLLPPQGGGASS
jgi:predicted RNase H-like HicB family nuclease